MSDFCLECGTKLVGRIDKKFCSDQCRVSYNNKLNRETSKYVRDVNAILRNNRKILSSLNPSGKTKINKELLRKRGFNFDFYTNTYVTKSGNVYRFCYEQGYLQLNDQYLTLVVREEYI